MVGGRAVTGMSSISAVMKTYPLTSFFLLAYALSWWAWILYAVGNFANPIASFGPFLAAVIVLALTQGRAGVMRLFRRMVLWHVGVGWYAVARAAVRAGRVGRAGAS